MEDTDLPIVANVSEILVKHYVLDLACNFSEKRFCGSVSLHLAAVTEKSVCERCQGVQIYQVDGSASNENSNIDYKTDDTVTCNSTSMEYKLSNRAICQPNAFQCCLDCQDIIVQKVETIYQNGVHCQASRINDQDVETFAQIECLSFSVDKWCLKIWKDDIYCAHNFPEVIKIYYSTKASGLSLLWVNDQDGRNCVFTYGAWINNRSLFPCQEPPTAMATWEAFITVEEDVVVLMSGDKEPVVNCLPNGSKCYYYYTKMKLPMSTLALAVGRWKGTEIPLNTSNGDNDVKCRLFASPLLLEKAKKGLSMYIPQCLEAAQYFLGSYPFPRIDILVVPRGFGSLGMASPNIIFLSQSVFSSNESMYVRVAHEIAHGWFGLLIGALDWTEEWLSEGFATFMEDIFHTYVMKMTLEEERDYCELRYLIRLKTLQAEVSCTDESLQVLRPTHGEVTVDHTYGMPVVYVKNGQNPRKGFLQVHYLKGFFLLTFLCNLVGKREFIQLLRQYINNYKGQLVQSEEIFKLYFKVFPSVRDTVTLENIYAEWLDTSVLPKVITGIKPSANNRLYNDCIVEANKWKVKNRVFCKRRKRKTKNSKKQTQDYEQFTKLQPDQLVIVLEMLLEEEQLPFEILKSLEDVYALKERNADVRHRWCELIVKHCYRPGYSVVQKFLKDDLAMGVYLYGELLKSGNKLQKKIAEECFYNLYHEMEPNFKITISEMVDQS